MLPGVSLPQKEGYPGWLGLVGPLVRPSPELALVSFFTGYLEWALGFH